MSKIAYIIPGYGENRLSRKAYGIIAGYFKDNEIKPIQVSIMWDLKIPRNFEDYNNQFLKKFRGNKKDKVYILGFSYGAVIAFMTAKQINPASVILCSLSPYFVEDYKNIKPQWLKWWKKNFNSELSFKKLLTGYKTKSYIIVGESEDKSVMIRARSFKRNIKYSELKIAKGAKHNIGNKGYLEAIKEVISNL